MYHQPKESATAACARVTGPCARQSASAGTANELQDEEERKLHAANPPLYPAKEGGRYRGKEISNKDGGRGFVPVLRQWFVSLTVSSSDFDLPDSLRSVRTAHTLIESIRRECKMFSKDGRMVSV